MISNIHGTGTHGEDLRNDAGKSAEDPARIDADLIALVHLLARAAARAELQKQGANNDD